MKVVIVGARSRGELPDRALVNGIIDHCIAQYPKIMIITKSCDRGVGKVIYDRCKDRHVPNKIHFEMTEFSMRQELFQEMARSEFLAYWNALNYPLVQVGEEFHILGEEHPKGNIQDLLQKVSAAHVPYALYKPSEVKRGVKKPDYNGGVFLNEEIPL